MNSNDSPPTPPLPFDFAGWWSIPEQWVEEPNRRRNGWSGMIRLTLGEKTYYVKKQCNHLNRSLQHPAGWPTVSREHQNIVRLNKLGIKSPNPVFHGVRQSSDGFEAILVTEELVGFRSLDHQHELTPAQKATLAREVGGILGIMHRAHLQHSCLYDKHIMVRWQADTPEVALIDLEKLRKPLLFWRAGPHDLDQLKRHQTIWNGEEWRLLMRSYEQSINAPTQHTSPA